MNTKLCTDNEVEREKQNYLTLLSHNPSLRVKGDPLLPTQIHYLNEEVDHVCVIALHSMHERTLATFDVLIREKKSTMGKVRECRAEMQKSRDAVKPTVLSRYNRD